MPAVLVDFPVSCVHDMTNALRRIADRIDAGEYGDVQNVMWVIDCGGKRVELGLLGPAPEPVSAGYFLLGAAQRKLGEM